MSVSFSDAAKAKELRDYFGRFGRIYIVVDATRDDVILPDNLKGDLALRLVLSMRMPQQIHIRDDRLESDFSFGGQIFPCRIPMHTIWGAYQPEGELEQGLIWEESIPEIIKSMMQGIEVDLPEANIQSHKPVSAPISLIKGGGGNGRPSPTANTTPPRKGSHLRVVK
ncbi:MAG: ClpXP protease specificity-enhancing factor SspB [Mariprofundus sp.]|nr:ClpXP protease specificity-enhancing factor SspB [Mariprofundus sp.]